MKDKQQININMAKATLRKKMVSWREQLIEQDIQTQSDAISRHLFLFVNNNYDRFAVIENGKPIIGLYNAFRQEADFSGLWYDLQMAGWDLAFPLIIESDTACSDSKRKMVFVKAPPAQNMECKEIRNWFTQGHFGLLEPPFEKDKLVAPNIIVMPGLAFDLRGNRLGWGKGYYDYYLAETATEETSINPLKLAAALDGQIIDFIPHDDHDIAASHIITPAGIITV